MKASRLIVAIAAFALLSGFSKPVERQMREHILSSYPAERSGTREIRFDWGSYMVISHAMPARSEDANGKSHRGYITMRPTVTDENARLKLPIYLITPRGSVWTIPDTPEIPISTTLTQTMSIQRGVTGREVSVNVVSRSAPIIDHFLELKKEWSEYGKLQRNGEGYGLRLTGGGG